MNQIKFISSGKQGLSLIINYLKEKHFIKNKHDEIFVPKFMGTWVYSSLNNHILTSPYFSDKTKIIHMYHQFGIPQEIDVILNFAKEKNLKVIEDCAHVLNCDLNNENIIGNNGDFTIYSFSKFIDCFLLGGIRSNSDDFNRYLTNKIQNSSKYLTIINLFLILFSKFFSSKKAMDINYSLYHYPSKPLNFIIKKYKKEIISEKESILKRYLNFKRNLREFIPYDYLKFDKLVCNYLPIDDDEKKVKILIEKFQSYKMPFKKVFFDINRNMLNPNYKLTIGLETGSKNKFFNEQVDIVFDAYKK